MHALHFFCFFAFCDSSTCNPSQTKCHFFNCNMVCLGNHVGLIIIWLQDLFAIVACVLHLGNLQFVQERGSRTQITDESHLATISKVMHSVYRDCLMWHMFKIMQQRFIPKAPKTVSRMFKVIAVCHCNRL